MASPLDTAREELFAAIDRAIELDRVPRQTLSVLQAMDYVETMAKAEGAREEREKHERELADLRTQLAAAEQAIRRGAEIEAAGTLPADDSA